MKLPQPPSPSRSYSLIVSFASNPVAANVLLAVILLGGLSSLWQIGKEVYPPIKPQFIQVYSAYPAASSAEVEEAICIPIEEAIHDIAGIQRLETDINEGECWINVVLEHDQDVVEPLNTLRARIQSLTNLPEGADKIEIQELGGKWEALSVMLHGPADMYYLKHVAQQVQDDLSAISTVARVEVLAKQPEEIMVEVSTQRLRQYRLTLQDVAKALRRTSLDLSGGVIRTTTGELLLQAKGNVRDIEAIGRVVLLTSPDGTRLRIGDVATIREQLSERAAIHRFDGQPSVGWRVFARHDIVEAARDVRAYVAAGPQRLPQGIRLTAWWDNSQSFGERLHLLVFDGMTGFILVFVVLWVFLSLRVAFWAAFSILISVMGVFWLMPFLGITLNMLSLFGVLVVIGILVDDVIIVGESIHRWQTQGYPGLSGALRGAREVAVPVTLAVLIMAVGFLPGLFLPGWAGQFMQPLCLVVILALVFSLVDALLILPRHLSATATPRSASRGGLSRLRRNLNAGFHVFIVRCYQPLLTGALRWRYSLISGSVATILIVTALVVAGSVPLSMTANVALDRFEARLILPRGTLLNETAAQAKRVEQALFDLRDALDREQPAGTPSVINHILTRLEQNQAYFSLELSQHARRHIDIDQLVLSWRQGIGDLGQGKIEFFHRPSNVPYDLEFTLSAADSRVLTVAAKAMKQKLLSYPGVYDVNDSRIPGKPEARLVLKPEAERLGLRLKELAEQVRQGFYGEQAARLLRGREAVKVMVSYPESERASFDTLLSMPVRLPDGSEAPLGALAEVSFVPGYDNLTRQDRRRVLHVRARIDPQKGHVQSILKDIETQYFQVLERQFPGVRFELGWYQEEQDQIIQAFVRSAFAALALMYVLLAISFRSYAQPLIFLFAVPVAWTGAVLGHGLLGLPLSVESLLGMLAASGVVVNDSMILLNYIQHRRNGNQPLHDLIVEACIKRLRPIALTFITTFVGILPILLETSEQVQFLIPMIVALAFGLLFGMGATLIFVPAGYAILYDLRRMFLNPGSVPSARE